MTADELKDGPLEGENRPLCDYRTKDDACCTKQAVERIKGRNLCSMHKRFGNTMEPVKGYASAQAESGDDPAKSEQIVKENAATEFANAQATPTATEPSFKMGSLYLDIDRMINTVLLNFSQFKNANPIYNHLCAAKGSVLKEMGGKLPEPEHRVPANQTALDLGAKTVVETAIENSPTKPEPEPDPK